MYWKYIHVTLPFLYYNIFNSGIGHILQYGVTPTGAAVTITLPISYTNTNYVVVLSGVADAGERNEPTTQNTNNTQFIVYGKFSGITNIPKNYITIGY